MDASPSHEKTSWPELVGVAAVPAVAKIMQDRPDVAMEVLPPGTHPLPGVDPNRVRIRVCLSGHHSSVCVVPHIDL